MPQDKRLIITKAVVQKVKHVHNLSTAKAAEEGVFLEFIVPSIVLQQCPRLTTHIFHMPHAAYPKNGRSTCLIVPKAIAFDCTKINKRHGYYDAVVTAEAICKRGDVESERRAVAVATTFSHFVVDARIISKLPKVITDACSATVAAPTPSSSSSSSSSPIGPSPPPANGGNDKNRKGQQMKGKQSPMGARRQNDGVSTSNPSNTPASQAAGETLSHGVGTMTRFPSKLLTPLTGLDDVTSLAYHMSQGAKGTIVRARSHGQCHFRVGNGGMVSGEVCDNSKTFLASLKREFPTAWKLIHEVKLCTNVTDKIRFMEVNIKP